MVKLLELDDYFINLIFALFLLINFDQTVGMIYISMLLIDTLFYYISRDSKIYVNIPVEKDPKNRWMNLIYAMGAYVAFIFTANFVLIKFSIISDGSAIQNISSLFSTAFSSTPILYQSAILGLLVWGLIIPNTETRAFFRTLLQWILKIFKIKMPTSAFSTSAFILAAGIGGLFSLFHLVAKGISDNGALFVTFLFGAFSVLLVIHFKEMIQALFLHILTNTIAVMQGRNIGFFEGAGINWVAGLPVLAGMLLVTWFVLFQEIPFLQSRRSD